MRAIFMWSDHGAPPQGRWWKSRSRRRTRSSTGLKILLAAGTVVAGVIGVSGVYPQVIDAEWMQGTRTYASRMPAPEAKVAAPGAMTTKPGATTTTPSAKPTSPGAKTTLPGVKTTTPDARTTAPDARMTRRSDSPASVQPPPRSTAVTAGDAAVATPGPAAVVETPGPAAVVATPPPAAPASKPLPVEAEPLAVAEIPDAAANADAPPMPAPTVAAKPAAPVVKRRIVSRAERPRRGGFTIGPFAFGGSPFRM
jgi:hypothetical protein